MSPAPSINRPFSKFSGGAVGAVGGFTGGAVAGAAASIPAPPLAILLVPLSALAGGTAGLVTGIATGVPGGELKQADIAITQEFSSVNADDELEKGILERATQNGRAIPSFRGAVDYKELAAKGTDTIIELSVVEWGLKGDSAFNPPTSFVMKVKARATSTADGAVILEDAFDCESLERPFVYWASDGAKPVYEEARNCSEAIGRNMARALFPTAQ